MLGCLLYISKYVKTSRTFLNRMLDTLRAHFGKENIYNFSSKIGPLMVKAKFRFQSAFRHSTSKAYQAMFRVFMAFLVFANIQLLTLTSDHVLGFLEFLVYNHISHQGIKNYLSAIQAQLSLLNISTAPFCNPRIRYFSRSLALTAPVITVKAVIDIPILKQIAVQCEYIYMGNVFKAAILLSFFSFLHISNQVPHAISKFNRLEQLTRADIILSLSLSGLKLFNIETLLEYSKFPPSLITHCVLIRPSKPSCPPHHLEITGLYFKLGQNIIGSLLLTLKSEKPSQTFLNH